MVVIYLIYWSHFENLFYHKFSQARGNTAIFSTCSYNCECTVFRNNNYMRVAIKVILFNLITLYSQNIHCLIRYKYFVCHVTNVRAAESL
jgi:hypothetical protein